MNLATGLIHHFDVRLNIAGAAGWSDDAPYLDFRISRATDD